MSKENEIEGLEVILVENLKEELDLNGGKHSKEVCNWLSNQCFWNSALSGLGSSWSGYCVEYAKNC